MEGLRIINEEDEKEIKIISQELNSESSKDTERFDEQWREKNEMYFQKMKNELLNKSNLHDVCSHKNKKMYFYTAIPSMILPLVLANVSIFSQEYQFIQPIGLTIVACINGLNTLYNFSKKSEVHNTYAGKYTELVDEINKVLIRSKKFREPFDVILERITMKKTSLDNNAPYL